jgi:hypothetical protein
MYIPKNDFDSPDQCSSIKAQEYIWRENKS